MNSEDKEKNARC